MSNLNIYQYDQTENAKNGIFGTNNSSIDQFQCSISTSIDRNSTPDKIDNLNSIMKSSNRKKYIRQYESKTTKPKTDNLDSIQMR